MSDSLNYQDRLESLQSLENPSLEELFPYLGDQDPAVLVTALNLIPPHPTISLVEPFQELATDINPSIRCTVANITPSVLPINEGSKLILTLLSDTSSDVIISALQATQELLTVVPIDMFYLLVTAVIEKMNNIEWRVRLLVQVIIPEIASLLGSELSTKCLNVLKAGMKDVSKQVRMHAILSMADLVELFGSEWGREYILPIIITFYTHPDYKIRQTALEAMVEVGCVIGKDSIGAAFLPMMLNMAFDKIPNVRLMVIQTLSVLIQRKFIDQALLTSRVIPCVENFIKDSDEDVAFLANKLKIMINSD
ncbi:HEAT repeat domain containing protein [Entamoeba marina]